MNIYKYLETQTAALPSNSIFPTSLIVPAGFSLMRNLLGDSSELEERPPALLLKKRSYSPRAAASVFLRVCTYFEVCNDIIYVIMIVSQYIWKI